MESGRENPSAEDRFLAALAYVYWYVAFPVYLAVPRYQRNSFLKYHMYHALVLGLGVLWGGVALWTISAVLGRAGLFGLLLYPVLRAAEWLALGVTVYAALQAWFGKRVQLPYVTEFVRPMLQENHGGQ